MTSSRIVMVGDNLAGPGGIAAVTRSYLEAGFFRERNVVYLSNYDGAGPVRQVNVMQRAMLAFLRLRFGGGVSLMHIHSASRGSFWRAAVLAGLARITGVPYVLHIHSGEFPVFFGEECGRLAKFFVRGVFQAAAGVICLTPGWKARLQPMAPLARMSSLPNPVVVPDVLPLPQVSPAPRLLFLGRLTEKKGLFDLFQAMPRVLKRFPALQLVVAGDGDVETARKHAREVGIEHAVVFLGWIDGKDKDRCLNAATIVVLPSHFEAFGVSILEAMAHGKPVVATQVGGVPEVLEDGVQGRLVSPHDPMALAEALIELLEEPELMVRLGAAGYTRARDCYATSRVMRLLGDYYDSLFSSARQGGTSKRVDA
jgi:glycosyltransferase involved in cell wall biosynthesis